MKSLSLLILIGVVLGLAAQATALSREKCDNRIEKAVAKEKEKINEKTAKLEKARDDAVENLEEYKKPVIKLNKLKEEMNTNMEKLNMLNKKNIEVKEQLQNLEKLEKEVDGYLKEIKSLEEEKETRLNEIQSLENEHLTAIGEVNNKAQEDVQQYKAQAEAAWEVEKSQLENEHNNLIKNMDEAQKTREDFLKEREEDLIKRLESVTMENANLRYQISICRRG